MQRGTDSTAGSGQLVAGQRIDRFVVERFLGRGGVAEVWQVRHHLLGTRHALKLLRTAATAQEALLLAEGRAQARLHHPFVLPVRDALRVRGRLALLLPLVEGPSLRALCAAEPLPLDEALVIARCVLEGLAFVHDSDLTHGDIKPENVLLELHKGQLRPRLADFGLVGPASAGAGTPGYAAPEQLVGAAITQAADLFSFGALLYELLTGQRAFSASTPAARTGQAPPMTPVPEGLRDLIAALLSETPADRPSSADVLARLPEAAPLGPDSRAWAAAVAAKLPPISPVTPISVEDTADAVPNNLAAETTPLIGRQNELGAIHAAIQAGQRLISVTGIGGSGKSHLARAACRQLLRRFAGGVWACDLSGCSERERLLAAVWRALGLSGGTPDADLIAAMLHQRGPTLVLLDGAEDVAGVLGALIPGWLRQAPALKILVTSRRPLDLTAAHAIPLRSLSEDSACALFAACARRAGATVSPADQDAIRRITVGLDGLPLAIELVAARAALLSPARLAARLEKAPRRAQPEALSSVLHWSWQQLSPPAQLALTQLSVLDGPFTAPLAEAVLALPGASWADDVLLELFVAGMLVQHAGANRQLRLLNTARQYAQRHLYAQQRHAAMERLTDHSLQMGLREGAADEPALVQAARWARAERSLEDAGTLAHRASYILSLNGDHSAALRLVEATEPLLGAMPARVAGMLLLDLAQERQAFGLWGAAQDAIDRAAQRLRAPTVDDGEGMLLIQRAMLARDRGDFSSAAVMLRQRLRLPSTPQETASLRVTQIDTLRMAGQYSEARAEAAQVIVDDLPAPLIFVLNRALIDLDEGRIASCAAQLAAGLAETGGVRARAVVMLVHLNLAECAIMMGELEEAAAQLGDAQQRLRSLSVPLYESSFLMATAKLQLSQGRLAAAESSCFLAAQLATEQNNPTQHAILQSELAWLIFLRGRLSEARSRGRAALRGVLAHRTAYTPLLAAKIAIIFAHNGGLTAARSALEAGGPSTHGMPRIALASARAHICLCSGDAAGAAAARSEALARLRAEGRSRSSPLAHMIPDAHRPTQSMPTLTGDS